MSSSTTADSSSESPAQEKISTLPQETLDFAGRVFDLARNGDDQTLGLYLNSGLPVNLTNEKGNTLLMLAAYNGHASTVRLLQSNGADVNRLNDRGQSPLAGAIFKKEDEVVRTLVELGADPLAGEPSALEAARIFGQTEWLELLGGKENNEHDRSQSEVGAAKE